MKSKQSPSVAHTAHGPMEYLERDRSQGDKKEVILAIHGAMGGYDQSDILGRTIGPDGYRYLAVSRPGYLKTPFDGRKSPRAQADLMAALLDVLKIDQVIVMAVSGGGYSALYFALEHRDRCKGLILCSTTGGKNTVPIPFGFTLMKILGRIPFVSELMARQAKNNVEKSLKRSVSFPDILSKILEDRDAMALFKALSLSTMENLAQRLPGTCNDIRITRSTDYALEKIQVPCLVIHGTHDPHVPFEEHGRKLAREIPGARLMALERGEHAAIFTHRRQVRAGVAQFLSQIG